MKLKLKDHPREWRKITVQTAVALIAISSLLRWKKVLPQKAYLAGLAVLGLVIILAFIFPRMFRLYYLASARVGFWISRAMGFLILCLFFAFIIVPMGIVLRLCGKDLLSLKKTKQETYWHESKPFGPLDRAF